MKRLAFCFPRVLLAGPRWSVVVVEQVRRRQGRQARPDATPKILALDELSIKQVEIQGDPATAHRD